MFRRHQPHPGRRRRGATDQNFFRHRRHLSSSGGSLRLIDSLLTDRSAADVWRSRAWQSLAPLWQVGGAVGLVLLWPGRWRRWGARVSCCLAVTLLLGTAGRAAMLVGRAEGLANVLYRLNFATLSLEALGGAALLLRMQSGRLQSFIFLWSVRFFVFLLLLCLIIIGSYPFQVTVTQENATAHLPCWRHSCTSRRIGCSLTVGHHPWLSGSTSPIRCCLVADWRRSAG